VKAISLPSFLTWRGGYSRAPRTTAPETPPDGLDAFATEPGAGAATQPRTSAPRGHRWTIAALAAIALVEAPVAGLWLYERTQPEATSRAVAPRPPDIHGAPLAPAPAIPELPAPAATARSTATDIGVSPRATSDTSDRAAAGLTVGGWVAMKTPVPMQVFEEGRLVGTSEVDRIMLPVGTHRLDIISDALGYRSRHEVAIRAGQTSTLRLEMPTGTLAVNAQPWAEVWIDGERIGETPIGNLTRTIGPHEVVFRHPELGEKKATAIVTLKEPARVGVDLRSKS
jgi:hypothetical protein